VRHCVIELASKINHATIDVFKMPAFMHCVLAVWPHKSVSSFLHQLTTWHCSRLRMLLNAGRASSDRRLLPAGPTAANPPQRRLNGGNIRRTDGRTYARMISWTLLRMLCEHYRYMFYRLFAAILLNVTVVYSIFTQNVLNSCHTLLTERLCCM